jgi:hypothetical protein
VVAVNSTHSHTPTEKLHYPPGFSGLYSSTVYITIIARGRQRGEREIKI